MNPSTVNTAQAEVAALQPAFCEELAILGGNPAFSETLHVGRPNIPDPQRFMQRMQSVLNSARLTNFGPLATEFEQRVAVIAGTRHCVATCNATTALELATRALGMDGEVIVPSFTFVADAHALWWQGVRPVFCDVDPYSHCIAPADVEAAITPRTTGILAVHLWSNPCAVAALQEIATKHGLKLLFDASHAFGCTLGGRPIGSFGHAEVFSFHATKFINAFEGGAITTDDSELAERLRLMTNFGFSAEDQVSHLGVNGKMSEASAAMGLTSLDHMDVIVEHNRQNHQAYVHGLADIPGVNLLQRDAAERQNYQYIVAEVECVNAGLNRNELVSVLRLENVMARRYFHPGCHRMAPYQQLSPQVTQTLPKTEELAERVMVLPTGLSVSPADISLLSQRIAAVINKSAEVRAALACSSDPRLPYFARA